jgi:hypothetical protein
MASYWLGKPGASWRFEPPSSMVRVELKAKLGVNQLLAKGVTDSELSGHAGALSSLLLAPFTQLWKANPLPSRPKPKTNSPDLRKK